MAYLQKIQTQESKQDIAVSLGERSASNYIYNIFKDINGIDLYGITDERLESIGFKSVARIEDLSVVGLKHSSTDLR